MATTKQWKSEVLKADPDRYEPEDVYEFSNSRTFKSTDNSNHGIYLTSRVLFGGEQVTFGGKTVKW